MMSNLTSQFSMNECIADEIDKGVLPWWGETVLSWWIPAIWCCNMCCTIFQCCTWGILGTSHRDAFTGNTGALLSTSSPLIRSTKLQGSTFLPGWLLQGPVTCFCKGCRNGKRWRKCSLDVNWSVPGGAGLQTSMEGGNPGVTVWCCVLALPFFTDNMAMFLTFSWPSWSQAVVAMIRFKSGLSKWSQRGDPRLLASTFVLAHWMPVLYFWWRLPGAKNAIIDHTLKGSSTLCLSYSGMYLCAKEPGHISILMMFCPRRLLQLIKRIRRSSVFTRCAVHDAAWHVQAFTSYRPHPCGACKRSYHQTPLSGLAKAYQSNPCLPTAAMSCSFAIKADC